MFARLYYKIVTMVFMNGVPLCRIKKYKLDTGRIFFKRGGVVKRNKTSKF